jgi:Na+/proline symporter
MRETARPSGGDAAAAMRFWPFQRRVMAPGAKGKRLVWISHMSCIVYSIIMAGFATGLYYAGIGTPRRRMSQP